MVPDHILKLRRLKATSAKLESQLREVGVLISEHTGTYISLVIQAGDGVCIYTEERLTPLSEDTFAEVLSLLRADAIQYIKDRSI